MNIYVLNTDFERIHIVDSVESFLWIERYNKYSEFEIYTPVDLTLWSYLEPDNFLQIDDSDYTMIIESRQIKTDLENGDKMIIKGRSTETILERRIIWVQTNVEGTLQAGLNTILTNAFIIGESDPNRIVSNFSIITSVDPIITALTLTAQFDTENIYDIIEAVCKQNNIGFRLILTEDLQFEFRLYAGVNRTYDQIVNSYVVFSPEFDNLVESNYYETKRTFKTISLFVGDESNTTSLYRGVIYGQGGVGASGINRKEVLSDASHLSRFIQGTSTPIDPLVYGEQMRAFARANMAKNWRVTKFFDGSIDLSGTFKYREDFFLGDIIQVENQYGVTATARIEEMVISEDVRGTKMYPVLSYQ